MASKMMRWRPWPPIWSKKLEVRLVVKRVEGLMEEAAVVGKMTAEVRWKGQPKLALRRSVKRNWTKEEELQMNGSSAVVEWNEEFGSVCTLTFHKENMFHPWEIEFRVFNGLKQGPRNKASVIGVASLNLAEYACSAEEEIEINLPLTMPGVTADSHPSLHLGLSLLELRTSQEPSDTVPRSLVPAPVVSPSSGDALPSEKDEVSALKAGIRKVKILTEFVSNRKAKKTCREDEGSEGRSSSRSEDADYTYPFDTDSLDDDIEEGIVEEGKEDPSIRKSFSYGTLATANYAGGSVYSDMRINGEYEDWVYYSHRRSDVGCSPQVASSVTDQHILQTSKRSILPWKKRKLSFRSPKAKGEPLLKKGYGEEGGDDIDYDRRQLSSSDESLSLRRQKVDDDLVANRSSLSDFGDDNFAVGSWESKDVVSRDGHLKLSTQVFFASIDQRSERAAGESACTALVAVIADWFQANRGTMPIKSQFDGLIRDGSLEWRNLCKNQTYRERFPDKHFDLETVLEAKVRPLSAIPEKSFIGFFHPEVTDENSRFDFLDGAMSFDSIWEEISRAGSECPVDGCPQLYVVSWNDHFFVLKVERDAYYIIDTLGERFYEGCDQAYILKFDESTTIQRVPSEKKNVSGEVQHNISCKEGSSEEKDALRKPVAAAEVELVCRGKESCKEYIKSFLASIPIRELQADIKKGLSSTPLHHRLQIEFHYTEPLKEVSVVVAVPQADEIFRQEEMTMTAMAISPSEEFLQQQESVAVAVAIPGNRILLQPEEEMVAAPEMPQNEEFLQQEEEELVTEVVPVFNLMPTVEVV